MRTRFPTKPSLGRADHLSQVLIPMLFVQGTRDALASVEDITAKGPLTLNNVIVLGNPFRFKKDNIDQYAF